MAEAKTIPILPCRDIDEAVSFYEALGFGRSYRQVRPNPYAVVARGGIEVHLCGVEGFDPAESLGSVIVAVPDLDGLHASFAAGLRAAYGKLPVAGIPRILRPRKRAGTVRGFTVVDPGGNWLRFSRLGDTEEEAAKGKPTGLPLVVDNAARLGDAHGDEAKALRLLDNGLARYPDAPAPDRARALLYRVDLAARLGDLTGARASLAQAEALTPTLTPDDRTAIVAELAHATELAGPRPGPAPEAM